MNQDNDNERYAAGYKPTRPVKEHTGSCYCDTCQYNNGDCPFEL